ncbi:MAG: late competence development ComFB family protein [Clostridium sp.]
MAKKTNKTSHVLNLITGGTAEPETELQPDQEDRIAKDIRRQLLSEMGEKETENIKREETGETEAACKAAAPLEEAEEIPEKTEEEKLPYQMVNVMEEIISPEAVKGEMEKYGVCLCSRCQADVRALMLTRLPAKYIVANTASIPPLLSYYKNKYRVNLLTQTIKACMDVREHPHHS